MPTRMTTRRACARTACGALLAVLAGCKVVLWRFERQVVVARGDRVRAYTFPEFRVRGAVPAGDAVYVIGERGARTVVLRLRE